MLNEINENLLLFDSRYLKQKEYWINKLSGGIIGTGIFPVNSTGCTVRMGPEAPAVSGTVGIIFPTHLCSRIMKLSKNSDLSLYIVLLSALKSLIYRYSSKEDILVMSPLYRLKVSEATINDRVLIYVHLDGEESFKELLLETRQAVLEAYENQDYPFDKLMEYLCNSLSLPNNKGTVVGCSLKNIHHHKGMEEQERLLSFIFARKENLVTGEVKYNRGIYEKPFIHQISGHFIKILENSISNIDIKISEISFLSEEEKKRMLFDFNNTRQDYPGDQTIHELFEAQAVKTPDRIAVVCKNSHITYNRLNKKADQFVRVLREKGVKADTIVGIELERSLEMIIGIFGILKAGGAYLPVDPDYPRERIDFILKDSGAKILLSEVGGETGPTNPTHLTHPTHLCYVIYTSGTTGSPKGVMLEHRSVVNYTCWAIKMYIRDEKIDFPLYTSISFDLTVTSIFVPLLSGNAVIIYHGESIIAVIDRIIDENRVGIIKMTPSHLKLIRQKKMNEVGGRETAVRRFILGGENLEIQLAADIYRNFQGNIEIYNEYGPTEAAVGCMIYKFDPGNIKGQFAPIGIPAANTGIYVLDEQQNPVPPLGTGELYISGDGVSRGYLNHPELSAEKYFYRSYRFNKSYSSSKSPKIFKTGDLARWLPDRNIECLGRKDSQVKIRGYRVELGEIENRLRMHDKIKEAAIVAKEESLCAYIVGKSDCVLSEIREYLLRYLPYYMIPTFYVQVEEMPLTPNGKLDVRRLPEAKPLMEMERFLAPRDEVEVKLAGIWSEVLGIEKDAISINANFFEIGGHSLKATILMSRIHKEFNVKITLPEIFEFSTIRVLSGFIKGAARDKYSSIDVVEKKEYYALSSIQARLYIMQQMKLDNVSYNLPHIIMLVGDLDRERLVKTFKGMIMRHESLRTSFEIVDEEPVQRIHNNVEFAIEYYDSNAAEAHHSSLIIHDFISPFALSKAPLLRIGLIETGNREHILMLDMHHIISDGTSIEIFTNEFIALYGGKRLPELRLQYRDFSWWHNCLWESGEIKRQEEYWLKEFAGCIPVLNLPIDGVRPLKQDFEGKNLNFKISVDETAALRVLAIQEEVTLFMVLLAVFNILLGKLSGQEEIIVGTAIAGRRHVDLHHIIGMFVNTLALRNYPTGNKDFETFLEEVKEKTLNAFENQDYHFEDLVDQIVEVRDPGRNPLFDVMFVLQNLGMPSCNTLDNLDVEIPGLRMMPYEYENRTSKFDLILFCKEVGEELGFSIEYNSKLFKKETIQRMAEYFTEVITAVVKSRHSKIENLVLEREVLIHKNPFRNLEFNI